MWYPTIPGLVLLAGAASVTVTAAAGLRNRPGPDTASTAVAVTSERTTCEASNRSITDATARLRSGAEVERLRSLYQDCSRLGVR